VLVQAVAGNAALPDEIMAEVFERAGGPLLRTFCPADQEPDLSPGLACGPLVIIWAPLVSISARAVGMVPVSR
jgi:hypothetical protein